jgi:hypothetical protein
MLGYALWHGQNWHVILEWHAVTRSPLHSGASNRLRIRIRTGVRCARDSNADGKASCNYTLCNDNLNVLSRTSDAAVPLQLTRLDCERDSD